ncbi:PEP-CTERM sorting domain-containing protein [Microcystis flos-aquae FACHB-1344]|uniref:PEP-CTERM sorting domain-containing protein n=1 Tax=Microcystis flos-aquae FACHB-1344 TaxID=2692899 RepID=A0ABR8HZ01_9CHRO|nr:PEP-CTERM sorting domain-containing protein [Microcystis flos-aquae]MBD2624768.1 PEP-CTERM sorting domain-containing protein [Microcystis flos-aquae FACHB-1344]
MFKLPTLTLITVASLLASNLEASHAAVVNGSFETGNFSDWNTSGQASVETSGFQVTPVNGNYQAVLQTCLFIGACDDNQSLTNANDLESFLGLSVNELSNLSVVEGSAIKQTITANAGDIFSFSWNFLTDEDAADVDYNDFAFFTLNNTLYSLADTQSSFPVNPSFSHLTKETGYQTYTIPISVTGNYILGFGVVDVDKTGGGNAAVNSALLVDNIKLTNIAKVPEPDTLFGLLLTLGLASKCKRNNC